jgi:phenylpyruvate tautomerase PptA (4-oxalocrotonate tautomerase family)
MPLLKIQTNVDIPEAKRQALLQKASLQVAEMLGKPEQYVMICLETGKEMLFAGSGDPLAYLELKSIGLPGDRTKAFSAGLCTLISSELGIPQERIYIEFADAARNLWGWNGGTFER